MPTEKLTTKCIEGIKPPAADRVDYFDAILPGLSLRVTRAGAKSWVAYYRSPLERDRKGRPKLRRHTLGRFPRLKLSEAREEARQILRRVEEGEDPQKEKTDAKRQRGASLPDPVTVEEGVRRYVEDHVKVHNKPRRQASGKEVWEREQLLERDVITFLGGKRITELRRKDVLAMHRGIAKASGLTTADRAAEALRTALNWLDDEELVDGVPGIRLRSKAKGPAASRHRHLTDDEIRALWDALGDEGGAFAGIVQILLLTGQRRNEVAGMRWAELDIDNAMWSLPPGRTKNGLPHLVPMSQPVIEIVEARDHIGEYVFTTTGVTPFSGFSRCKARVDRRMGDRDWVLHDLRRTFVTRLNELGVQPHIVEAAVNHITGVAKAGVAGIYNHAQYLDERAMALTRWADTLLGIVGEGSGGIVLELRQRGQGDV